MIRVNHANHEATERSSERDHFPGALSGTLLGTLPKLRTVSPMCLTALSDSLGEGRRSMRWEKLRGYWIVCDTAEPASECLDDDRCRMNVWHVGC